MTNNEAWFGEEQIYIGTCKSELINEILNFVARSTLPAFDELTGNDIVNLNLEALSDVGIKVYLAEWKIN